MAKATRNLKTGMTVLKGGNVSAYTLEFLNPSRRKKTGEYETIVVPYVEIGRSNECIIQYGNESNTVSRRHAAIERREDGYYVLQLSQTNPTLLNGQPVGKESKLNTGDEIQLSLEGPKLRFNISTSGTDNMGYTQKLSLMANQALKPYKIQIRVLLIMLLVVIIVGIFYINKGMKQNRELKADIVKTEELRKKDSIKYSLMAKKSEEVIAKQIDENSELKNTVLGVTNELSSLKQRNVDTSQIVQYTKKTAYKDFKDYIYYLEVVELTVKFPNGDISNINTGWNGTAFLCDDGRLITARHCIQNWRFHGDESSTLINYAELNGGTITLRFRATSSKDWFEFKYTDVIYDDSGDMVFNGETGKRKKAKKYQLKYAQDLKGDWAYCQTSKVSPIHLKKDLSQNLEAGENLMILGFSADKEGTKKDVKPLLSETTVAQSGISTEGIITVSDRKFEAGNSGGPVFVFPDDSKAEMVCIGIISFGDFETRENIAIAGGIVPIANVQDAKTN